MSESGNDKKNNETQLSSTYLLKTPLDAAEIELTQKIEIDYEKVIDGGGKRQAHTHHPGKELSGVPTGKSIFTKKRLADDYLKSSTILSAIGSVPPLEKDLKLQPVDSNYELKHQFSEGAQGIIRTAFDKALKRNIVVKSLKPEEEADRAREDESLFVSEARIMAQLDHPSIIPLYGLHCGTESKLHLAMKHIHGKTLQKYLQDTVTLYECEGIGRFDEKRSMATRIEYLIKVCEAVDYAHCKGVVHRDLKPENIMIGNYGEVYVMDWGLACLVDPAKLSDDEHLSDLGSKSKTQLAGTPCYIAPELIRGGECSPQSDIFSLGLILFELVTLTKAVPGETVNEVLRNIVNWNYRPFKHRFLKGRLSPDLKSIVAKAICEPPAQRYRTAGDMAKDLKLFLRREETAARPDNLFRKYVRAMINHKLVTSIVILSILLGLSAVTIRSLYLQNQLIKEQKQREARLTFFQHGVAERANEMELIFAYLKTQLANLAYRAGCLLNAKTAERVSRIYRLGDFSRASTAPDDYAYAPSYGTKVSLNEAVFQLGTNTRITDNLNRRIIALRPMLKHVLFTSGAEFQSSPEAAVRQVIITRGAPLNWIFIGLKNGSMLMYPGNSYAATYDPRHRPWYKSALEKKRGIVWSKPYQDAMSAKIVMCCAQCVYDEAGIFQGVIGMDVSLDYIRGCLFSRVTVPGLKEYLLNDRGQIVLSSDFKNRNAKTQRHGATLILEDFPFRDEFRNAVEHGKVQFEAVRYDRKYIFALNRVPSLGYYYLEQVSDQELRKAWEAKISNEPQNTRNTRKK
ncbi:MAG: serine/threonine protein kinase [Victivallaceae bacterium]|nr:serine/threonine protein kinase [Victivallaceae bacterium]